MASLNLSFTSLLISTTLVEMWKGAHLGNLSQNNIDPEVNLSPYHTLNGDKRVPVFADGDESRENVGSPTIRLHEVILLVLTHVIGTILDILETLWYYLTLPFGDKKPNKHQSSAPNRFYRPHPPFATDESSYNDKIRDANHSQRTTPRIVAQSPNPIFHKEPITHVSPTSVGIWDRLLLKLKYVAGIISNIPGKLLQMLLSVFSSIKIALIKLWSTIKNWGKDQDSDKPPDALDDSRSGKSSTKDEPIPSGQKDDDGTSTTDPNSKKFPSAVNPQSLRPWLNNWKLFETDVPPEGAWRQNLKGKEESGKEMTQAPNEDPGLVGKHVSSTESHLDAITDKTAIALEDSNSDKISPKVAKIEDILNLPTDQQNGVASATDLISHTNFSKKEGSRHDMGFLQTLLSEMKDWPVRSDSGGKPSPLKEDRPSTRTWLNHLKLSPKRASEPGGATGGPHKAFPAGVRFHAPQDLAVCVKGEAVYKAYCSCRSRKQYNSRKAEESMTEPKHKGRNASPHYCGGASMRNCCRRSVSCKSVYNY